MQRYLKIFFTGLLVSFAGSLPLGTLNLAAMQIAISDGYLQAIWFAIGVFLVEIVYVRISLVAMDKIRRQEKILKALEWVTLCIVAALAVLSFAAAFKNSPHAKNVLLSNSMPRFLLGVIMSALNPMQIPFWFGWSTVLFTKKILLPRNDYYNVYIGGIGTGTFTASCLFIFAGRFIFEKLITNQKTLHLIIACIFALTALIQAWKMWRKKDAVQKIHDLREDELHSERAGEKL